MPSTPRHEGKYIVQRWSEGPREKRYRDTYGWPSHGPDDRAGSCTYSGNMAMSYEEAQARARELAQSEPGSYWAVIELHGIAHVPENPVTYQEV